MSEGYLYCFSNKSMSNILKVGMTERTPEIRLKEANASDTWRPPTPYKLEFAKKVNFPKQKESVLHKLLSQYTERINPKREFFRISLEEVRTFFELIDGEFEEGVKDEDEEEEEQDEEKTISVKPCRDMRICFTNGQRIRHIIGINKIWIGVYDLLNNEIVCNGQIYQGRSPLNQFAKSHYQVERNDRTFLCNAWSECECEVDGKWVSTFNLPIIELS